MEEKKNGGLVVPFIIVIILLLGLVGYICYDKFFDKKESVKNEVENDGNGPSYTFDDVAGVYYFTKKIDDSEGKYGNQVPDYFAYIILEKDGTIRFDNWVTISNGYIGNYVIKDNQIIITK